MTPQQPDFFAFEMIEVYVQYDRPLLFACRDVLDQTYLAVLTEEEEDQETWIYVAVSPRRFEIIRSGGIDLFTAFKTPEAGILHRVSLRYDSNQSEVTPVARENIQDDWLPKPGFRLELPTATAKRSPTRNAVQSLREVVMLRFNFPGQLRTEAPAHILGEVLTSFQNLVSQIGQRIFDAPAWFSVVGFDAGSFEIELNSNEEQQYNLFRQSPAGDAMKELIALIEARETPDSLSREIRRIGAPIADYYVRFLNSFAVSVTEFDINWASPREGYGGQVRFNQPGALSIIEQVKQQAAPDIKVSRIDGVLKGLSLEKKTFDIQAVDGCKYHGRVVPEALNSTVVQSAQLNRRYIATIEEKREISVVTGRETQKRMLLNLSLPPA